MKVYLLDNSKDLELVADYWEKENNGNQFGLITDRGCFFSDVQKMIDEDNSVVLVLAEDNPTGIVGFMGVRTFISPLSNQKIANEHYWYVIPEKRGIGSIRLIKEAIKWSKAQGCSHILLNASMMASNLYEKVCSLYEKLGAKKFETSFALSL